MTKIKVSTDSTADLPRELARELGVDVLPMTIIIDGKEYADGVDLTTQEFYEILNNCAELPTTSQVTGACYQELFTKTWEEGYTHLIHTSINSLGSGTYQAALLNRELFFEEHPEARGQLEITVIDSLTYSMGYGWGVIEGARLAKSGASPEEVVAAIEDWIHHHKILVVPMNLRFCKKSGRVSAAAAFVGDAMGLKPIITFENGESKVLSKVRGDKKAVTAMVDMMVKERKPGTDYCMAYTADPALREQVEELLGEKVEQMPSLTYPLGAIISANIGPDSVGLIFHV